MTAAGRRFDDVLEGDELGPVALFLSKDQVRAYARAVDHYFPRFTDDEGARREGLPGMITPGNMSMGLLTTLVDGWAGAGRLRRLGTTFRGLVLPDRTIRLCGAVTQKDERDAHGGARRLDGKRRGRAARDRHRDRRARLRISHVPPCVGFDRCAIGEPEVRSARRRHRRE